MTAQELTKIAKEIRKDIIRMINKAGSGHPAGSLGVAEILVALYYAILNHDPKEPDWYERDRFILSNGHVCPAHYAVLSSAGYFDRKELLTLRKLGSKLQGHPLRGNLLGIETTSGPLGEGLGQAVGMALASRMDGKHFRIYCLTSDGEHDCGSHWEAVLLAAKYKLANLTLFVDRNNIQIDGKTENVLPLDSLFDKYMAFNWNVKEVDGHDIVAIVNAVKEAKGVYDKPTVIICKTTPGKGVSFMEDRFEWHGKAPNDEEARLALEELK